MTIVNPKIRFADLAERDKKAFDRLDYERRRFEDIVSKQKRSLSDEEERDLAHVKAIINEVKF